MDAILLRRWTAGRVGTGLLACSTLAGGKERCLVVIDIQGDTLRVYSH